MKRMKYTEILKKNTEFKNSFAKSDKKYEIVVLSNIITNHLKDILEYSLRAERIYAYISFGNYDNIVQDSVKFKDSKLVIIFWELANIIDGFQYKANIISDGELNQLIEKMKSEIDYTLANLKNTSLVLINKFSSIIFNYPNIEKNNFDKVCDDLNNYLASRKPSNVKLIDIDKIIADVSISKSVDFRYYYSSKSLYTVEFYKHYSNFISPIILSANGKGKKVFIFDCDNTLWKGILGEDGFDKIEMSSKTPNGSIFEEVQSIALELSKKGVLIGLCSKNNPHEVENVINNHKDMTIKDENITIKKINWNNKMSNLKSIAKDLNVGIDSLVLVDDSDFEVNFIKEKLPEVKVLKVPVNLHEYPAMIREKKKLLYNISESKEDLKRVRMYKQEIQRKDEKKKFDDLEDYLKSLELKMIIYIDEKNIIPRIAQLTQKTNQFNLTTKRYLETDIEKFINNKVYRVFAFEVSDKYGDYGITGLCILKLDLSERSALFDTFLMSCRVIGRNLEYAFLNFIINYISRDRINYIKSKYIKTSKNKQVSNFYNQIGMKVEKLSDDVKTYTLELSSFYPKNTDYIGVYHGTKN